MADSMRALTAIVLCLAAAAATPAVAADRKEEALRQLAAALPGHYDTRARSDADPALGSPPREPLVLEIIAIYAPLLGEHVFYEQEMSATNALRVTGQRIVSLALDRKGRIVQRAYQLREPLRWRDGQQNPDLFKSLMLQDVTPVGGCEITWRREGARFVGKGDAAGCRVIDRASGATLRVEQNVALDAETLEIGEKRYDAAGKPLDPPPAEPVLRFIRR